MILSSYLYAQLFLSNNTKSLEYLHLLNKQILMKLIEVMLGVAVNWKKFQKIASLQI